MVLAVGETIELSYQSARNCKFIDRRRSLQQVNIAQVWRTNLALVHEVPYSKD